MEPSSVTTKVVVGGVRVGAEAQVWVGRDRRSGDEGLSWRDRPTLRVLAVAVSTLLESPPGRSGSGATVLSVDPGARLRLDGENGREGTRLYPELPVEPSSGGPED